MSTAPDHPRCISHYEILAQIGEGGMGEVYVAFDTTLQRKVALKAVRRERRLDDQARARLLREARILSQLDHPGICRIYDYVSGDTSDYLVLELIDGTSLRTVLRSPIDRSTAMRIAEQVANVLVVAHAAGVVHRDLKPENIMLLPDGSVKVLDFGLARSVEGITASSTESAAARLTLDIGAHFDPSSETIAHGTAGVGSHVETIHGLIMGSPRYMSPEQASGEPATAPSDMYSFGLLLQEVLTGRPPYPLALEIPAIIDRARRADTSAPTGLARDIADLIGRLKSLAPSQRPTAVETVERLRRIREKPRRRLRIAVVCGLLVLAAAAAAKYTVDLARERTVAVLAREEANRRRNQAEDLIGFMLGDLRTRLQGVGRLDLLDSVGEKATAYFAAVPPEALSDEEMFRRSQAIYQIGQVRMARGDLKGASERFTESLDLVAALARRDPGKAEWQVGLATSHFYVGDALRLQGDLDGAMRHFSAYRDIGESLASRDPNNREWVLESSYGHSNVAAVLEGMGKLEEARGELERSIEINRRLLDADPKDQTTEEALANVHNRLAVVLEKLGDGRGALEHHLQSYTLRRRLLERNPQDSAAERRLAIAASWVSILYRDQGDMARAWEYDTIRYNIFDRLVARDPANTDWQRELGIAHLRAAILHRVDGDAKRAVPRVQRAIAILRPLADKDPSYLRRQQDALAAEVEQATIQLAIGQVAAAHINASRAAAGLESLIAKSPEDTELARLVAESCVTAAEALARTGDTVAARAALERARALLEPRAGAIKERRFLNAWTRVLRGLERHTEADALTAVLRESGFRPYTP